MRLSFFGAAHEVTGSCHLLQACGKNILIDCGMEQGEDIYENQELPVNPAEIDYILVTHAHIDHIGLVPLMYAKGFRGEVHATEASSDLASVMLRDSAHIQMFEAEWRNRKARRSGKPEFVPLYEMKDVLGVTKLFVPHEYDNIYELTDGIKIRFNDAGHLLGSSCIEVWASEPEGSRKLVFSGDIGNIDKPILRDPKYLEEADYVIMESTYGDRLHDRKEESLEGLARITEETLAKGGNLVIPAFAVGRTQELLYFYRKIKANGMIKCIPDFKVYIDSPLAIEATAIFQKNMFGFFDEEATELIEQGINPLTFKGLRYAITSDESKQINNDKEPKVIISASGMCEAGRVRHHLKHNLWQENCTILFSGYQAINTLGRKIIDGADEVKLFGETVNINARIERLDGISGHADMAGLIRWITAFKKKPSKVFVVHGEDSVCDFFADKLSKEHGLDAVAPFSGASFDLITGECISAGERVRKTSEKQSLGRKTASAVYARLIAAGQRLLTVIKHNEGGANKDLAKFADQINALCDKWDR